MTMAAEVSPIRKLVTLDRVVHEPARLAILVLLSMVERADFLYILDETGLSKGNLSSHMTRLEEAGLVKVEKSFFDKIPRTVYELTKKGARALETHRDTMLHAIRPG